MLTAKKTKVTKKMKPIVKDTAVDAISSEVMQARAAESEDATPVGVTVYVASCTNDDGDVSSCGTDDYDTYAGNTQVDNRFAVWRADNVDPDRDYSATLTYTDDNSSTGESSITQNLPFLYSGLIKKDVTDATYDYRTKGKPCEITSADDVTLNGVVFTGMRGKKDVPLPLYPYHSKSRGDISIDWLDGNISGAVTLDGSNCRYAVSNNDGDYVLDATKYFMFIKNLTDDPISVELFDENGNNLFEKQDKRRRKKIGGARDPGTRKISAGATGVYFIGDAFDRAGMVTILPKYGDPIIAVSIDDGYSLAGMSMKVDYDTST